MFWTLQSLATLVAGGLFIYLGLRGKFKGSEPRCPKCTYQLTGLQSDRCPECGTSISPKRIRHGLRKRRWLFVVFGILLWTQIQPLQDSVRSIIADFRAGTWKQHLPFAWHLSAAERDDLFSLGVLRDRLQDGRLSRSQRRTLATLAVDHFKNASGSARGHWRGLLAVLDSLHELKEQDLSRLMAAAVETRISFRPTIREGEPFVIEVDWFTEGLGVSGPYCHYSEAITINGRKFGEQEFERRSFECLSLDGANTNSQTNLVRDILTTPGAWNFRYSFEPGYGLPFMSQKEAHFDGTVQVLSKDATDPVTLLHDPDAIKLIQAHIWNANEDDVNDHLDFQFDTPCTELFGFFGEISNRSSYNLAFDCYVEAGELDLPIELVTLSMNRRIFGDEPVWNSGESARFLASGRVASIDAPEVFIVLRSSPERAKRTVNIYTIWGGELRFGPFKVRHLDSK